MLEDLTLTCTSPNRQVWILARPINLNSKVSKTCVESLPWWGPFYGQAENTHGVSFWDPSEERSRSALAVRLRGEFVQSPSFYSLLP